MKTYVSLAVLKGKMGITSTARDDDLAAALVAATRIVDLWLGNGATADDDWTGDPDDLAVATTPDVQLVEATLYLAVRLYKSPDAPFGFAGMTDQGMVAYVRGIAPELDLILFGQKAAWGIA